MIRFLAVWVRRLDTGFRLLTFGSGVLQNSPHEPLPDPERPGFCGIDGLALDDALHRRRPVPRPGTDPVAERGWR